MAALGDPIPASKRRPSSAELSFACNAICPKLLCKVDFSTFHAALKPVSVPLSVAHIRCTLAWRICSELKPIVSDSESFWYQPDVPGDSQDMFIHLQVC